MKRSISGFLVGLMLLFTGGLVCGLASCEESPPPTSSYETRWSDDKKDSVVYVNYVNQDGGQSSFFMNYLLFHTLFSRGGYGAVYNHYTTSPSARLNNAHYSNYSPHRSTSDGTWKDTYSSPSRKSNSSPSYTPPRPSSSPSYLSTLPYLKSPLHSQD